MYVLSLSFVSNSLQPHRLQPARLLCPWGFSRPEYWNELSCSPPGDLANPGIQSRSPTLQVHSLLKEPPGKPVRSGQVRSVAQSCPTLCDPMNHSTPASLSITNSWSSLGLTSIESVMPSSHLILCRPLLLLPPIPPSIRDFSNESTLRMRWPKYWSFSFSIIPSEEIPRLISFRMDWLDLLAVQETLKSLLQHHSSKASILWRSAFFRVQLSHPYRAAIIHTLEFIKENMLQVNEKRGNHTEEQK